MTLNIILNYTSAASPILQLYKPCNYPLAIGFGMARSYSAVSELKEAHSAAPYIATAIQVISLASTIIAHPAGMIISTVYDMGKDTLDTAQAFRKGAYQEAFGSGVRVVNNSLYLAAYLHGGLQFSIASLTLQIGLRLYQATEEFKRGNRGLACIHLLATAVQMEELRGQIDLYNALQRIYLGEILSRKLDPETFPFQNGKGHILLIRHAETDWNVSKMPQGWNDIPLNETGRQQAQDLAQNLSGIPIAAIYSSPLLRASVTAEYIAKYHPHAKIITDPTLRFYDPEKRAEVKAVTELDLQISRQIGADATAYVQEVSQQFPGQNVVILTHGKVIRHFIEARHDPRFDGSTIKIDNRAVVVVTGDEGRLSLETLQPRGGFLDSMKKFFIPTYA